eukprot:g5986.t1
MEATPLQTSLWVEGSAGSDIIIEATSSPGTATALAVLVIERLVDALEAAEAAIPLYLRKRRVQQGQARSRSASFSSLTQLFFGATTTTPGGPDRSSSNADDDKRPKLQALVLVKNREIAASVTDALQRIGKGCVPNLAVATLTGGVAVAENAKTLEAGCHVAVGTPGRVKFLMDKGVLRAEPARQLVLESADWLLAPVFLEDVRDIVGKFPQEKQVVASSTVEPTAAIVESLCALVGVPALKRLDASGSVQETRVRMPTPLPSPAPSEAGGGGDDDEGPAKTIVAATAANQSAAAGRPSSADDGGSAADSVRVAQGSSKSTDAAAAAAGAGKGVPVCGRPAQQAVVAVASAKERLLMETRQALSISSSRQNGGGGGAGARMRCSSSLSLSSAGAEQGAGAAATGAGAAGASQPSRARAMTGPASDVAATTVATIPGVASCSPNDQERKRHSYDARRINRTVSFGCTKPTGNVAVAGNGNGNGNGSGRAPPPDYSLVSKGMFGTTSTSTTAPSSSSESAADPDERRASPCGSNGRVEQGQAALGASGGGGDGGNTRGALSRAGAQDDDAASTLDLLSPGAFKGDVAAMVAKLDKQQQKRPSPEGVGRERGDSTPSPPRVVVVSDFKKQLAGPTAGGSSPRGEEAVAPPPPPPQQQQQQQQQQPGGDAEDGQWQDQGQDQERESGGKEEQAPQAPPLVPRSSSSSSLREEEWHMPPVLLTGLEANGVMLPTPLQEAVWKGGRGRARADLIVHGRPGDETATAFCVPVLERVLERYPTNLAPKVQSSEMSAMAPTSEAAVPSPDAQVYELVALVLTRTREMATDIAETLALLGQNIPSLSVATLIGGVPVAENHRALANGCNVAVGTPGRVKFLMKEGVLKVSASKMLVLDSADWLMAPVFQHDVGWIAGRFPKDKQVLAFSGADPKTYEAGLTALVGSSGMTPIGCSCPVDSSCTSTAMVLEQGEALAAALTGAGAGAGAVAAAAAAAVTATATVSADASGGESEARAAAAATAAACARPAPAAGGGGDATRGPRHPHAHVHAPHPTTCATRPSRFEAGTRVAVGGVIWPPPGRDASPAPAIKKAPPIRTLGMMREESARRAQGLGTYGSHMMGGAGWAAAPATSAMATGSPPNFLARGPNARGGKGVNMGSAGGGSSSTASTSSACSAFRARVRSSTENEIYGAWCA